MNIVAQILGLIALILIFFSYQQNKKVNFLLLQIFSNISFGFQYVFLKAYSGLASNIISIIRTFLFYKIETNNKKISIRWLLIFELLIIICGVFTFDTYYSLLPIFIACLYTYGTWQSNLKVTYKIGIIAALIWIYYNFIVGAYVASIGSIFELIASIFGYIKIKKSKKN